MFLVKSIKESTKRKKIEILNTLEAISHPIFFWLDQKFNQIPRTVNTETLNREIYGKMVETVTRFTPEN